jgi:hypothetical protein
MKNILKDLRSGALPWTALIGLLYWTLFVSSSDDEFLLIGEN